MVFSISVGYLAQNVVSLLVGWLLLEDVQPNHRGRWTDPAWDP